MNPLWGIVVLIANYLVREHAKTDGKTSNNLSGNTSYRAAA